MVVLDGNFALDCGPGTDYPSIHIFQCVLEWTLSITNKVLEKNYVRSSIPHCTASKFEVNFIYSLAASPWLRIRYVSPTLRNFLPGYKAQEWRRM